MAEHVILVERTPWGVRLTLNRPDKLNAISRELRDALTAAVAEAADDDRVRVIAIAGAGRAFSSGADLGEQRSGTEGGVPDLSLRLRELYNPIILGVRF